MNGIAQKYTGEEVILGIRPENMHDISFSANLKNVSQQITADVEVYEPLGSSVILELKVDDINFIAQVNPATLARIGSKIDIFFDLDKVHIFDPITEQVINLRSTIRKKGGRSLPFFILTISASPPLNERPGGLSVYLTSANIRSQFSLS